jgi:hypothetical protein
MVVVLKQINQNNPHGVELQNEVNKLNLWVVNLKNYIMLINVYIRILIYSFLKINDKK